MSTIQERNPNKLNDNIEIEKELFENDSNINLLEQLGFDEWFHKESKSILKDGFSIARIIEVNKNNYKVSDGNNEIFAELTGKYVFNATNSIDYPTIGDWVIVQYFDNNSHAIIHDILPRKSLLKRKDPGKVVEFQLIAANIDFAFIIQSADSNFNLNRLERYLVMIHESNIQSIIVLSKTDLVSADELSEIKKSIKRLNDKYLFFPISNTTNPISNTTNQGIDLLCKELKNAKTYCLLGSSGVGKTTLLNTLIGEELYYVNAVREKDQKGRHTTTKRQLIRLESGSLFIDTPGMRELGNFALGSGLNETFADIVAYFAQCRFNNCTHSNEEGCAVIEAVEQGNIEEERYENFLKIQKESAYYEMSYLEKRKKNKSFGKLIKNYNKSIRKK